jgi:hypothetical protein
MMFKQHRVNIKINISFMNSSLLVTARGLEAFQLIKATKEKVKHGIRMYYIF